MFWGAKITFWELSALNLNALVGVNVLGTKYLKLTKNRLVSCSNNEELSLRANATLSKKKKYLKLRLKCKFHPLSLTEIHFNSLTLLSYN